MGRIAAGTPIEAIQTRSHTINMPSDLLTTGEHFALEVRGDSMIEAGILDGDMALLKRSDAADTGDIVVALIDDEEATLKRFRRRGASIALEPANTAYEVRILPPNRVRIQGKLVGSVPAVLIRIIRSRLELRQSAALHRAARLADEFADRSSSRRRRARTFWHRVVLPERRSAWRRRPRPVKITRPRPLDDKTGAGPAERQRTPRAP